MKYKVGDVVTIREWEDMEQEFGSSYWGTRAPFINTTPMFVSEMKRHCGKKAVIVDIYISSDKSTCFNLQFDTESGISMWSFGEQMFVGYRDEEMVRLESHAKESNIVGFLLST